MLKLSFSFQPITFSYGSQYYIIILFYKFDNSFYYCSGHDYAHKICSFVVKQIAGVMGTDDVLLALQSFYVYTTRTHIFTYMQHYIWNYKSSMVIIMAQQRSTPTIIMDGWKIECKQFSLIRQIHLVFDTLCMLLNLKRVTRYVIFK